MATALYSQSLGDLAHRSIYNLQLSLLDEADAAYTVALGMAAPAEANIPAKVDYGLGQIATLRCYIGGDDWLLTAETHFWAVVDAYKAGNASLGQLAADVYAGLGTIAVFRKDTGGAIVFDCQAAEEAAPFPLAQGRVLSPGRRPVRQGWQERSRQKIL